MLENIYTTDNTIKITLRCHKDLGNVNDEYGRYYEAGKDYECVLEPRMISKDTNYQKCTLCWISFNDGFGSRFSVVGNIYHSGKGHWTHFSEVFDCPVMTNRDSKISEIISNYPI